MLMEKCMLLAVLLRADAAIACLNYRMLLPNVVKTDDGPYRTPQWIRWVMRAIMQCKMVRVCCFCVFEYVRIYDMYVCTYV